MVLVCNNDQSDEKRFQVRTKSRDSRLAPTFCCLAYYQMETPEEEKRKGKWRERITNLA